MKIILAEKKDLVDIKEMYVKIINNMISNGITIWNEYYPIEVFEEDIRENNLYLLKNNDVILGAFALYEHKDIESDVKWKDTKAKAYLLNRVGVNVDYIRQGIGQKLVEEAAKLAKEKGAKFLRLLVVKENTPAIKLYDKCKFERVEGLHEEKIRDDYSLFEYAYEKDLNESDVLYN